MLTFVFFQLVVTQRSSLAIYGNAQNQSLNHIKSATAITEVVGDGQKLTAVAVENDKDISSPNLPKAIIEPPPTDERPVLFVQKGQFSSYSDWRNHDHRRHKVGIRS